jgi:hypothetical protein
MEKRYAHIAEKYLNQEKNLEGYIDLEYYLDRAHSVAMEVAIAIGVPRPFWPVRKYGALRVLEYGPTAITNRHTDFDLFTLMCYRNLPEYFQNIDTFGFKNDDTMQDRVARIAQVSDSNRLKSKASELNTQIHFGEILEEVDNKTFVATPHEVIASNGPWQYSVVYFAIPDHSAVLPSGVTVGKWLEERISRSRYQA